MVGYVDYLFFNTKKGTREMNANELADAMQYQRTDAEMVKQAVIMLRQQQAEIEALKDMLEEEGIGVSQKYLDERIAEMKVNK